MYGINICMCMCRCMYAHTYVCAQVFLYVNTCACMYGTVGDKQIHQKRISICAYIYTYIHRYRHVHIRCHIIPYHIITQHIIPDHIRSGSYINKYVHTHIYIYIFLLTYVYVHTYITTQRKTAQLAFKGGASLAVVAGGICGSGSLQHRRQLPDIPKSLIWEFPKIGDPKLAPEIVGSLL